MDRYQDYQDHQATFRIIDQITDILESYFEDRQKAYNWMLTWNASLNEIPRIMVLKGGGVEVLELVQGLETIKELSSN